MRDGEREGRGVGDGGRKGGKEVQSSVRVCMHVSNKCKQTRESTRMGQADVRLIRMYAHTQV